MRNSYKVLSKRSIIGILTILFAFLTEMQAQDPIANFNVSEVSCINENVYIKNVSSHGVEYKWDFCIGELDDTPTAIKIFSSSDFQIPIGTSIINQDGIYYGLICSRGNNRVYLLKFGENPGNTPTIINSFSSPSFNGPEWIELIKEEGKWVGYLVNYTGSRILRLYFNKGITSVPIIEDLGDLGGLLNYPRGLELKESDSKHYLFISNTNADQIVRMEVVGSWLGNLDESAVDIIGAGSGIDNPIGISLIDSSGYWYGLVSSNANNKYFHLDFGLDLSSQPIITEVGIASSPVEIKLIEEGGEYYGFGTGAGGDFYRISFGESPRVGGTVENLGDFNGYLNNAFGFDIVKDSSTWQAFSMNYSNKQLTRLDFENICRANISFTTDIEPNNVYYTSPGEKIISLKVTNDNKKSTTISRKVTVKNDLAPQVAIQTNANLCLGNPSTFTAQNLTPSQTLTSLTWNFGDGTSATGPEVTHQYTSPGTYTVRLTVESEGGCGNFIEKEVNIYEAPEPEFTFPAGVLCTNGTITFENTTLGEYNDDITWTWNFGDGTTSDEKHPSHTYATGGTKTVTLTASIPGCEATVSHELEVIPGPSVDFSAANLCFGEDVQFTNLSTGNSITDYAWDFGNGETSTAENPTVTYAAAGTYEVSLTVNNTSGCSNTLTKSIVIHSLPEVDFDHALVCSGSPTPFEDRSTVEDGSISSWLWSFGDGTTSTEKNPVHIFAEPGTYEVKLKATSSWGCIDSTSQMVLVKASPKADFVVERGCPGTTSRFIDTSIIPENDQIVKRVWVINSASFFSENPEIKFSLPGTYSATLTVTSNNGCQSSVTKSIVIDPLPEADFNYQNACIGEKTIFTDLSQSFGDDEIIGWNWKFGNITTSIEQHPEVTFPNAGDVPVTLTVTTDRGCVVTVHKTITISALPRAAFTTQTNLGAPPLRVSFKNNTSGAVSYQWLFGDPANSTSTEENPTFVYTTLGEYEAKLIATNAAGCIDTASMTIKTLIPNLEVALEQVSTFNTSGDLQLVLKVTNKGSITIEDMDITLDLGGQLKVKERFTGSIAAGESINYPLSFEILEENLVRVPYVCASLSIVNTTFSEENLEDNSACKDIAEEFVLLTPFPNPVNGTFYVSFVMPEKAPVRLVIADMLGETVVDKALHDAKVGYNSYDFDFSSLTAGMYVIKVIHGGQTHLRKVVVR